MTAKDDQTQPQAIAVFYDGDENKPWKPCKTMIRVMAYFWGNDAKQWVGRFLTLHRDDKVMWGGEPVGGIRILGMSHIKGTQSLAVTASRGSKKKFTVQEIKDVPAAKPEKEVPPHVAMAKKIAENIELFNDTASLQSYMAEDAAEDLDAIQKASEATYAHVVKKYDEKKAKLEIPA